jgi:hypothetical protein
MARKPDKEKKDFYFQVHSYMLRSEAWLALSAPARAVYIQLGSRYRGSNNGYLTFSVRDAATECRLSKETAARAFKELLALGFIDETRHGGLSRKTRMASQWRLTAFYCDLTKMPKSCRFMQCRRAALDNRLSQTRVNACPKIRKPLSQKTVQSVINDGTGNQPSVLNDGTDKALLGGSPVLNDCTHVLYHVRALSERDAEPQPLERYPSEMNRGEGFPNQL